MLTPTECKLIEIIVFFVVPGIVIFAILPDAIRDIKRSIKSKKGGDR